MGDKAIASNEKVLTVNLTHSRVTYEKFTPIKELPDEVQALAKARGFIDEYGKVFKQTEKNIDYKKEAERLKRENATLKATIAKLTADIKAADKKAAAVPTGTGEK